MDFSFEVSYPTLAQNIFKIPRSMTTFFCQVLPINKYGKGIKTCIVMQEASDALSKTADSDTVSTYQVSSVHLVTDKKLEAFNKA